MCCTVYECDINQNSTNYSPHSFFSQHSSESIIFLSAERKSLCFSLSVLSLAFEITTVLLSRVIDLKMYVMQPGMTNLEDRQPPKHFPSQRAMKNVLQFQNITQYLCCFALSGWRRAFDKQDMDIFNISYKMRNVILQPVTRFGYFVFQIKRAISVGITSFLVTK